MSTTLARYNQTWQNHTCIHHTKMILLTHSNSESMIGSSFALQSYPCLPHCSELFHEKDQLQEYPWRWVVDHQLSLQSINVKVSCNTGFVLQFYLWYKIILEITIVTWGIERSPMFFHFQAIVIHTLLFKFLDDTVHKLFKARITPLLCESLLPGTILDNLVLISWNKSLKGMPNYTVKKGIFRFYNLFDLLWWLWDKMPDRPTVLVFLLVSSKIYCYKIIKHILYYSILGFPDR